MSWNEMQGGPPESKYGQKAVALAGGGIVLLFIIAFALIVHFAGGDKKSSATPTTTTSTSSSTTTTTTPPVNTPTTLAPPGQDGRPTTTITVPAYNTKSSTPNGDANEKPVAAGTVAQLAATYPRSKSNLSAAQFDQAVSVSTLFATADATGAGANQFSYYYNKDTGPVNLPWIKNMNIKWVFATEPTVGTIQVTVWYQGTVVSSGKFANLVTQQIFLDKDSMEVIYPRLLKSRGMDQPTPCCVAVVTSG